MKEFILVLVGAIGYILYMRFILLPLVEPREIRVVVQASVKDDDLAGVE